METHERSLDTDPGGPRVEPGTARLATRVKAGTVQYRGSTAAVRAINLEGGVPQVGLVDGPLVDASDVEATEGPHCMVRAEIAAMRPGALPRQATIPAGTPVTAVVRWGDQVLVRGCHDEGYAVVDRADLSVEVPVALSRDTIADLAGRHAEMVAGIARTTSAAGAPVRYEIEIVGAGAWRRADAELRLGRYGTVHELVVGVIGAARFRRFTGRGRGAAAHRRAVQYALELLQHFWAERMRARLGSFR